MSEITQAGGDQPNAAASAQPAAAATSQPAASASAQAPAAAPVQQQATQGTEAAPAAGTEGNAGTAPEKYEFKAPEGIAFDAEVISTYSNVAKELGLPQDAAQKLIDQIGPKIAQSQQTALKTAIDTTMAEWQLASKSDKEFGGERFDANLGVANKAIETFGTPALRKLLDDTGIGGHPEVIRAFFRAGKQISEDRFVPGGARTTATKNPAQALYGKH
jgi:hypothetical protein